MLVKALPKNVLGYDWQVLAFRYQLHDSPNYTSYGFAGVFDRRKNPEKLNLIWVRVKRREFTYIDKNPSTFAFDQSLCALVDDVMRRISAAAALDPQAKEDVLMYAPLTDQSGYAGEVALADFKRELHRSIARAFLECQRNLVIEFVARLTPESLAELEDIEICAGVRAPRPIVPPPPPPKSAAELLTEEVKRDWVHLRTAEVKRKLNNKAYKEIFDRLMNAGELKSQVTSYMDGAAEFRQ